MTTPQNNIIPQRFEELPRAILLLENEPPLKGRLAFTISKFCGVFYPENRVIKEKVEGKSILIIEATDEKIKLTMLRPCTDRFNPHYHFEF